MTKTNLLDDTFEKLTELGVSTVKKTVKSVAKTLNPLDPLFSSEKSLTEPSSQQIEKLRQNKNNHTPLNFEKLNQNYQEKDKAMQEALRQRLFQLVRQGEERLLQEDKQKEMERKRKEEWEKEQLKRKEEEQKKQQQPPMPMGKIRRSIFSPKKVAQRQHIETKASSGKQ
ncbi:MAG: hypothetical protein ACPLRN_00945 [Microgenomates group bacterium]